MTQNDIETKPLLPTSPRSDSSRDSSSSDASRGWEKGSPVLSPRAVREPPRVSWESAVDPRTPLVPSLKEAGLSGLAKALARPTLGQLQHMAARDPEHRAMYARRARAVCDRYASLTTLQKTAALWTQAYHAVTGVRRWVMSVVHPATHMFNYPVLPYDDINEELVARGRAERVQFFTRDHALLDGLLVGKPSTTPLPVLVLALGNGMFYECMVDRALQLAATGERRVLLYNDRGVGRSTGSQHSTSEAVSDCRAAIGAALERSNGTIDVFGISLGGGKSAAALRQAEDAGEIRPEQVRTYVNCHSFTSLPTCAGQLLGLAVGFTAKVFFRLFKFDELDAQSAFKARALAQKSVVFTADTDEIMLGAARLGPALAKAPLPGDVAFHTFDQGHNDIESYFEPGHAQYRAWNA